MVCVPRAVLCCRIYPISALSVHALYKLLCFKAVIMVIDQLLSSKAIKCFHLLVCSRLLSKAHYSKNQCYCSLRFPKLSVSSGTGSQQSCLISQGFACSPTTDRHPEWCGAEGSSIPVQPSPSCLRPPNGQ